MADFNTDEALANFDQQTGNGPGSAGYGPAFNEDQALSDFDLATGNGPGSLGYMNADDQALYNFDNSMNPYGSGGPSAGVYGNPAHPNTSSFSQAMANLNNFFANNKFGQIANAVIGFTPAGALLNGARRGLTGLAEKNTMGALTGAMGAVGGPMGAIGNLMNTASRGGNMAPGLAGMFGSMVGGGVGGQAGSMLGGQLGSRMAGMQMGPGYDGSQGSSATGGAGGGYGVEGAIGDLAKLYAMSRASSGFGAAKDANGAIQNQINSLSEMYSPNGAYAQQLRQQLERKDAAAGRRSQYGPREVQLQAALADRAREAAGTIGNLAQQSQNQSLALKAQKDQQRAQQLAMLMRMGSSSGLFSGLSDIFSGNNNNYSDIQNTYSDLGDMFSAGNGA